MFKQIKLSIDLGHDVAWYINNLPLR